MKIMSNINFTSVIPVKVIANGKEAKDEDTIRKSCNALIREIAGPIYQSKNEHIRPFAATLNTVDPHYNYFIAYTKGYKNLYPNAVNSEYIKTIISNGQGYIVTGPQVDKLNACGYEIGSAKKECKFHNVQNSSRLQSAVLAYQNTLRSISQDKSARIREIYDYNSKQKMGNEQEIELHVTSKVVNRNNAKSVVVKSIDRVFLKDI